MKRVLDNMDVHFCNDEMTVLNTGLKYLLHAEYKDWIKNLALEVETVFNYLPAV
jgi:hypothetical protein